MTASYDAAIDAVVRLDRTIGWPKEKESRSRLVDALLDACNRHRVSPDSVISECLKNSQYCPTDFDIEQVAKGIHGPETWQQTKTAGACASCHGTGWKIVYALHSREGEGEYSYVKKDMITKEVYERIAKQLDPQKQQVFSGAKRCRCATEPQEREWTTAAMGGQA
jgi:hypothetical protein